MSTPISSWPYPRWIAHRGAGRHAPENTLAAFRKGVACGFRMMEYDVKLSADDVPILLHDDTLERTSNGKGRAADLRHAELARYDFGAWHSAPYAGEPVATLYSIAAYTRAMGVHSNIEIKPSTGVEDHTGARIALLARELWQGSTLPPLLSSFSEVALAAAAEAAPELPVPCSSRRNCHKTGGNGSGAWVAVGLISITSMLTSPWSKRCVQKD